MTCTPVYPACSLSPVAIGSLPTTCGSTTQRGRLYRQFQEAQP